jgi:hypothetical protein
VKKKSQQKNEIIGFNVEETIQKLNELLAARKKVAEEIDVTPQFGSSEIALKHALLTQQLKAIENNIVQVREWYNVGVSESLYHESKRLNTLTIVLIILTATLGGLTIIDILSRVIK